jgi:LysM repeat protein
MMGAQQRQGRVEDASAKRIVYYKVRKGDNLWNIAQSFKVPVRELTTMNDITLDTTLFPGVVLKVPLSERL